MVIKLTMAESEVPPILPPKGVPLESGREEKKDKGRHISPERSIKQDDRGSHAASTTSDPDPLSRKPTRQSYAQTVIP